MEGVCDMLAVEERQGSLVGDEVYFEFRLGGAGLFVVDWVVRYGGNLWAYDVCSLRARYGLCSQLGSMRMWLLGEVCLCACALYMACSRACLSL